MSLGVVKFFDNKKGFGFIKWGGEDLFVHYSDIISDKDFKKLETGDNVEFERIDAPRGPQAIKVKRL
ncbi:cold-shock protein [uncultured Anaerococcus sp.]|uniref:cold-shock protein n=1 Tax=uncultured Anaerococcus sp. TaxID=293428 RepID=UPI0025FAA5F0|nr:cold shock domain-containing protein [uncultured Anaerococcus sp.]